MKKISFLLLISLLTIVSCGKKDSFTINGTLENGAGKTIWLEELSPKGPIFIDSIKLDKHGEFKYIYKMPYPSLYNLHTTANNYIVTIPNYGDKLEIKGDWENLSMTYTIKGSHESNLLWQLQQYSNDGENAVLQLIDTTKFYSLLLINGHTTQKVVDAKREETDSIFRNIFKEQQDYMCRFIEENKGSLSTLIALYKPFNGLWLINERDPNSLDYYEMVLDGLETRYPDNPHTLNFKNTVEHLRSALAIQQQQ